MPQDFYKDFGGSVDTFIKDYSFGDSVTNFPSDPITFDEIFERLKAERKTKIIWTGYKVPFTVVFVQDTRS
jgi:hypothetical protein